MSSNIYSYVVSADIYLLLQDWAKRKGFILPPQEFFTQLREKMVAKLTQIFGQVELIGEEILQQGLTDLIKENNWSVISLDRIYVKSEYNLDLTRVVDKYGEDTGIQNRGGTLSLTDQLRSIKRSLFIKDAPPEVALVDDVIFSGNLLLEVINLLQKEGIKVVHVYAGIGVSQGVGKIRAKGIPVSCVEERENVVDEVCERDFYPGAPLSGRLLEGTHNVGLPYIQPYGQPGKWASIPEKFRADFSKFCWEQTIQLFVEIEKYSDKIVSCQDLDRLVIEMPADGTRFVDAIQTAIDIIGRYSQRIRVLS